MRYGTYDEAYDAYTTALVARRVFLRTPAGGPGVLVTGPLPPQDNPWTATDKKGKPPNHGSAQGRQPGRGPGGTGGACT